MIDWMLRYVRRRWAELDRSEAVEVQRTDVAIRQVCMIADVPHLADGFIAHGINPVAVTRTLCQAIRHDPVSGRVAALQGVEFLAPVESGATWDAQDRLWLREMERAFAGSRDGETG